MTDGRCSGHIGTRNNLVDLFNFDAKDRITQVHMLASPDSKYVQGFKFVGYRTNSTEEITLVEAVGLDQAGEWQIYDLKPGE